jgi:hypothetical protein
MRPPTKKEAPAATGAVLAAKHQTHIIISSTLPGVNAGMVQGWMEHGRKLASRFLFTKATRDRIAFERHMGGILQRIGGVAT